MSLWCMLAFNTQRISERGRRLGGRGVHSVLARHTVLQLRSGVLSDRRTRAR